MHKSVVWIAALAASALVAEAARAKPIRVPYVSQSSLAIKCKAANGQSYSQSGGVYGCVGANTVECDSKTKTCTGTTKTRTAPGVSTGVLTGTGIAVSVGARPPKANGVLGTGILEGGPALGSQGPAATGSPSGMGGGSAGSSAPRGGVIY